MSIRKFININTINNNKKNFKIKANDEDLLILTNKLPVTNLLSLDLNVELTRNMNRFILKGYILTDLIQECSNTLEDIELSLNIPLKRVYEKRNEMTNKKDTKKIKDIFIYNEDEDEDEIDILEKDSIDLESLLLEELMLNINPFIKKRDMI